jgi:hypothetical protein
MLAGTQFASASPQGGGVLRVGMEGASVPIDPQFETPNEDATSGRRVGWADVHVSHPEGLSFQRRLAGDREELHLRDRPRRPGPFYTDEIVGGKKVHEGKALHVSGVVAKGSKLIIRLIAPDGAFLSKITMPVFQATSTKLPLTREVTEPYPTAGPYVFTRTDVNKLISIRRNPYWKRGPGRQRPRNLAGIDVFWGLNEEAGFKQVEAASSTRARYRPRRCRESRTASA